MKPTRSFSQLEVQFVNFSLPPRLIQIAQSREVFPRRNRVRPAKRRAARVLQEPVNLLVAGFLGSPPMNLVSRTVKADGNKIRFREMEGGMIDVAFSAAERTAAQEFVGKNVTFGNSPGRFGSRDLFTDRRADAPLPEAGRAR
jgi:hypothetical protein